MAHNNFEDLYKVRKMRNQGVVFVQMNGQRHINLVHSSKRVNKKSRLTKDEKLKLEERKRYNKKWNKANKKYFQQYYEDNKESYREAFEKYRHTDKGKEAIENYENSEKRRKAKTEWMRNYRKGLK